MAQRRMFTMKIIESDAFLDMPLSTQCLYFHLCMRADDDGFVNNPKRIQAWIGATDDDMRVLVAKRFVLTFESGVIVIKHWRMHNLLRKDRYNETQYQEEKASLSLKENGSYTELATEWQPNGNQMAPQVSIGKLSKEKEPLLRNGKKEKVPPTVDEVKAYCEERNNNIDAELFCDYYTARDWILTNGKKMKDWKAAVRTWEKNRKDGKHDTLGTDGKGDRRTKKTSPEEKDYDKW